MYRVRRYSLAWPCAVTAAPTCPAMLPQVARMARDLRQHAPLPSHLRPNKSRVEAQRGLEQMGGAGLLHYAVMPFSGNKDTGRALACVNILVEDVPATIKEPDRYGRLPLHNAIMHGLLTATLPIVSRSCTRAGGACGNPHLFTRGTVACAHNCRWSEMLCWVLDCRPAMGHHSASVAGIPRGGHFR